MALIIFLLDSQNYDIETLEVQSKGVYIFKGIMWSLSFILSLKWSQKSGSSLVGLEVIDKLALKSFCSFCIDNEERQRLFLTINANSS